MYKTVLCRQDQRTASPKCWWCWVWETLPNSLKIGPTILLKRHQAAEQDFQKKKEKKKAQKHGYDGRSLIVIVMLKVNFKCSYPARFEMYVYILENLDEFSMKFSGDYLMRILLQCIYGK